MSDHLPGGESVVGKVGFTEPGPLVDHMRIGLEEIARIRSTLGRINEIQQLALDSFDTQAQFADASDALEVFQHIPSDESTFFLESRANQSHSIYPRALLERLGYSAALLSKGSRVIVNQERRWERDVQTQSWIGRRVHVVRPAFAQRERQMDRWGKSHPPYTIYGPGTSSKEGRLYDGFTGILRIVTLSGTGSLRLITGEDTSVNMRELFEVEAGKAILPRVAIVPAEETAE